MPGEEEQGWNHRYTCSGWPAWVSVSPSLGSMRQVLNLAPASWVIVALYVR